MNTTAIKILTFGALLAAASAASAANFTLTVNGYDRAAIADFPVLVRLSETGVRGFSYSAIAADRSNLLFKDADGNELAYDVDTWDVTGESTVWVRIPSLEKGATFTCEYGEGVTRDTTLEASSVWSDQIAVWHLSEDSGDAADASGNGFTAVPTGSNADGMVGEAGIAGLSRRILPQNKAGADLTARLVTKKTFADLETSPAGVFTVTGWVYLDRFWAGKVYDIVSNKPNKYNDQGGFELMLRDWGIGQAKNFHIYGETGDQAHHLTDVSEAGEAGRWLHFAGVFDGTSGASLYLDGAYRNGGAVSGAVTDLNQPVTIGGSLTDSEGKYADVVGRFDEVRITRGAKDADYVFATYASVKAADFLLYSEVSGGSLSEATPVVARTSGADEKTRTPGVFTVSIDAAQASDLTVNYTVSGTAEADVDYVALPGSVTIPAGETSAEVAVTPLFNLEKNVDTTVTLAIAEGQYQTSESSATLTIVDFTPTFYVTKLADASEAGRINGRFQISMNETLTCPVTVKYTLGGTAEAGVDVVNPAGAVTIPASETSATVEITPYVNIWKNFDTQLVLTVGYGSDASATLTVANAVVRFKTVPLEVVGYDATRAELADVPVLVRLSESIEGFRYADLADPEHGSDLFFTDATDACIPHEIDSWDPTGTSLVWVRLPVLRQGARLSLNYGLAGVPKPAATETFADYTGVWHMSEASGETVADATGHGLDAVPGGTLTVGQGAHASVSGVIGKARVTAPANLAEKGGAYLATPSASAAGYPLRGRFTFSAWCRGYAVNNSARLFGNKTADGSEGWSVESGFGSLISVSVRGNGDTFKGPCNVPSFDNLWEYLTFVYDNTSVRIYCNGELKDEGTVATVADVAKPLVFGNIAGALTGDPQRDFWGEFDEIRLSPQVADGDRVWAEYAAMSDAGFLAAGRATDNCSVAEVTPTVAVGVSANERLGRTGTFRVSIGQALGYDLNVLYSMGGTAENGVTYAQVPGTVTIPAGAKSAIVQIVPLSDPGSTKGLTVVLTVEPGKYLTAGASATMAFTAFHPEFRIPITVSGLDDGDELVNFPLLVKLSTAIEDFSYARFADRTGGSDLFFTDASGKTVYEHEIETWNPEGESRIWVKIPKTTAGMRLFAHYGLPDQQKSIDETASFWSDYTGVWHMNETTGSAADATGNGLAAEPQDNGDGTHWYSVPFDEKLNLGDTFTVSGWFYADPGKFPTQNNLLFSRKAVWAEGTGWEGMLDKWDVDVRAVCYGASADSWGLNDNPEARAKLSAVFPGTWAYVTFVYSPWRGALYVNGELIKKDYVASAADSGNPLQIGGRADLSRSEDHAFHGQIREVRYGAGEKSAAWIRAEYLNQKPDSDFLTYGPALKPVRSSGFYMVIR